jgi:DNA-binding IclR family transcriptional regulator
MATPDRTQYLSDPVRLALRLQDRLLSAWPEPQSVAALVQHTGATRDQVYRGLCNLEAEGCAVESDSGWMPGTTLTSASETIRQRTALMLSRYLGTPLTA